MRILKEAPAYRLLVIVDASHRGSLFGHSRLFSCPQSHTQIQVTIYKVYGQQYYRSKKCGESIVSYSCSNSHNSLMCWYARQEYPLAAYVSIYVPSIVLRVWRCWSGCGCHGKATHGYGKQCAGVLTRKIPGTWYLAAIIRSGRIFASIEPFHESQQGS